MPSGEMNSIDEYERWVGVTIAGWSPEHRTLLAAAMAERWWRAYEAFSVAERWGDAASLRRALDAVWDHARGVALAPADRARHAAGIEQNTPHMDDFEAYEALAACAAAGSALDCCERAENAAAVMQAVVSGFHAVEPEWDMDADAEPRLWRRAAVRKELRRQRAVIDLVGAIALIDEQAITQLRREVSATDLAGEVRRVPARATGRPTYPNKVVFDTYRRRMTSSLARPGLVGPIGVENMIFVEWMVRYGMRHATISGKDTSFADAAAPRALVERNRARDGLVTQLPEWPPDVRRRIDLGMQNPYNDSLDVHSLELPHAYGPSLRRLWTDAKRDGRSDADAWQYILAWAQHRPAAWEREDQKKKKKKPDALRLAEARLRECVARPSTWTPTGDLDYPWAADVDGQRWQVRLNDFPDDVMYTLIVAQDAVGDLHDWPLAWDRA